MRSWLACVLLATGCRGILGIDEARLLDAPDQPPSDGGNEASLTDANACFGSGLVRVCLAVTPSPIRTFTTSTIDTSTTCDQIVVQPSGAPSLCVLAAGSIDVPTGATVRVVGARPLVLVSTSTLTISGTLSASSQRGGLTGAGAVVCNPTAPKNDTGGGGGGAGGSFTTVGGNGGTGDLNDNGAPAGSGTGGGATTSTPNPQVVAGGCAGSRGGEGTVVSGAGGAGGGALYMIARDSITVAGSAIANGAGGTGGTVTSGGGGGGGAGGHVGFDAPMITIAGIVTANGGGGGGGAGTQAGGAGNDGAASLNAAGGGASPADAGGGGNGATRSATADFGGNGTGGGGGGGGGLGYVYVKGTLTESGTVSPAPSIH